MYNRLFFTFFMVMSTALTAQPAYKNPALPVEARVADLLSRMTLEEKAGQLNQQNGGIFTGPSAGDPGQKAKIEKLRQGIVGSFLNVTGSEETHNLQKIAVEETRLGIPLLFGFDVIHGYRTIFPIPLAEACAWDRALSEKATEIAALEASAAGLHWTFAPMMDVSRDPRWGRVMEGAGEDPFLAGEISAARVRGFQKNLAQKTGVLATVKHFGAYGAVEAGREYNVTEVTRQQLFNLYLPPYKAAIDAGAATIMNGFNTFEGIPVSASHYLNTEILRNRWKFNGFLVSDWNSFGEMIVWGYAADRKDAAKKALLSGSMMDMFSETMVDHVPALVREGSVPEALLNEVAGRILTAKFRLGLFEQPFAYGNPAAEKALHLAPSHRKAAREAAQQSIVVLKNVKQLLPLSGRKKIALIGELADKHDHLFDFWIGKGDAKEAVTVRQGLETRFGTSLKYAPGYTLEGNSDANAVNSAVKAAKNADVVIVVAGLSGKMAGEDRSLVSPEIPVDQIKLLEALRKTGKPVIVLVQSARPLVLTHLLPLADAVVQTWILGTEHGNAVADVLLGDAEPGGRTVMTFPAATGQIPIYYNHFNTGRPKPVSGDQGWTSRYRDAENEPLFPFGFGLGYSTVVYGKPEVSQAEFPLSGKIQVKIEIANTGKRPAIETAQLYIRDRVASIIRPVKELKDFRKITLNPGERQTVVFELSASQLGFFDNEGTYVVEPGDFDIMTGPNSRDVQTVAVKVK
jgi:beta-glucosidase